uniref:C2H2-type domain-containing protein n=1 Tax=Knipowitschia caucasica TaxID=637954 RepID=A0AAV2MDQ0_KNICA
MANGIAKIAPSFTPQSAQNNNGSYSKARIVTDVNYHPSTSKHPLKPIQIKPVVSNSKFVVVNTPAPPPPPAPAGVTLTPGKGYECRVCHVYFESINVLQRHKCAKAHEFLMKHKLSAPGNRQRSAAPLQVPSSSVKNVPKPILPAPMSSTDRRLSNVTKDTSTAAADDDCFIVESGPEKPAEVIYQVTSSVPITT